MYDKEVSPTQAKKKKENYSVFFLLIFMGGNYKTVTTFTFMIFKTLKPCI